VPKYHPTSVFHAKIPLVKTNVQKYHPTSVFVGERSRSKFILNCMRALYEVALADRKPAAMWVHDGDKKLFPLSTPCTVNRRPLPNPNFQLLPCAKQFIASFPIFSTRRLPPLISITSPLLVSITSPPPAFADTTHV
jgi:hypothetical protein